MAILLFIHNKNHRKVKKAVNGIDEEVKKATSDDTDESKKDDK